MKDYKIGSMIVKILITLYSLNATYEVFFNNDNSLGFQYQKQCESKICICVLNYKFNMFHFVLFKNSIGRKFNRIFKRKIEVIYKMSNVDIPQARCLCKAAA